MNFNEKIAALDEFIQNVKDSREYKRALAVKMTLKSYPPGEICSMLGVSTTFISRWKKAFEAQGVEGLKLGYRGTKGFLTDQERQATLDWLTQQTAPTLQTLKEFVETSYNVLFKSRQSYYDLLAEANFTRKKVQRSNPAKDEAQVEAKKKK